MRRRGARDARGRLPAQRRRNRPGRRRRRADRRGPAAVPGRAPGPSGHPHPIRRTRRAQESRGGRLARPGLERGARRFHRLLELLPLGAPFGGAPVSARRLDDVRPARDDRARLRRSRLLDAASRCDGRARGPARLRPARALRRDRTLRAARLERDSPSARRERARTGTQRLLRKEPPRARPDQRQRRQGDGLGHADHAGQQGLRVGPRSSGLQGRRVRGRGDTAAGARRRRGPRRGTGAARIRPSDLHRGEPLVLHRGRGPHRRRQPRPGQRGARHRGQRSLRAHRLRRRSGRLLPEGRGQRRLDLDRERRHARAAGEHSLLGAAGQGPAIHRAHARSRPVLSGLRRRFHHEGGRADAGEVLRAPRTRRIEDPVGQLRRGLPQQRPRAGRPHAVRRQRAPGFRRDDEIRRAQANARRLCRRPRNAERSRAVPWHGRLAVLPAAPRHHSGLGSDHGRGPGQGLRHRPAGHDPRARHGLRHRRSAGAHRSRRAVVVHRRRQPDRPKLQPLRQSGVSRRALRVPAGPRPADGFRHRRPGQRVARRPRRGRRDRHQRSQFRELPGRRRRDDPLHADDLPEGRSRPKPRPGLRRANVDRRRLQLQRDSAIRREPSRRRAHRGSGGAGRPQAGLDRQGDGLLERDRERLLGSRRAVRLGDRDVRRNLQQAAARQAQSRLEVRSVADAGSAEGADGESRPEEGLDRATGRRPWARAAS